MDEVAYLLAQPLDAGLVRVAIRLDHGRLRRRTRAGYLVIAAQHAERLVAAQSTRSWPSASTTAEQWISRFARPTADPDVAVTALLGELVWEGLLAERASRWRRSRYDDAHAAHVDRELPRLLASTRHLEARGAVLQELVHTYAPRSCDLPWWTSDPQYLVRGSGLSSDQSTALAALFEGTRAAMAVANAAAPRTADNVSGGHPGT